MSNDILSGGRIDESTDGPNPPSVDPRGQDILGEQKAKEQQDAVGGTQYAPRVEPPPSIPVAPEVAPPLPVVPSVDFNVSGSVLEEVREITRQAMVDAFKNVTINGQSPSIEGSAISFNVQPPQPSASESFMFQSGEVVQAGPPTAVPPPQPTEDVQTVVVSPPSRPREEPESISEQRERENTERDARDQEIRVSLGLDPTPILDQPSETVTTRRPSISEQNEEASVARAQRDTEVRASVGLSGESPMDEESDSAQAYQRAEARSDERRESDPDFNRESAIRQKGETITEFKERQEQLKQEKIERAEREEKMSRIREGDLTEMPSGMVPIKLTRADGKKKILALMATELFGTVEGAVSGERTLTLPPKDSYFEGGGGGGSVAHPWKITIEDQRPEGAENPVWKYKIESASRLFDGFGGTQVTVSGADGVFRNVEEGFYFIEVNFSNGNVSQANIQINTEIGAFVVTSGDPPVQTKLRQQIGYVFFEDDVPKVRQNAWHNYTLFDVCRNGVPVKVTIAT